MIEDVRMVGGPFNGAELDIAELFAGNAPASLAISIGGRLAVYDFDIDAEGDCYQFRGYDPPERPS